MIEIDRLGQHPEKTLDFISEVSREAGGRITTRMLIGMPILEEEGLDNVLSFLPMAKEGFALNLRNEDVTKDQTKDLLNITKPVSLNDFVPELGLSLRKFVVKDDPRLSLFRHSLTVLTILSGYSRVDSFTLNITIPGESHWPHKLDKEDIWTLLTEVEDSTRRIVLDRRQSTGREQTMRALHFFEAGKVLAENLK